MGMKEALLNTQELQDESAVGWISFDAEFAQNITDHHDNLQPILITYKPNCKSLLTTVAPVREKIVGFLK